MLAVFLVLRGPAICMPRDRCLWRPTAVIICPALLTEVPVLRLPQRKINANLNMTEHVSRQQAELHKVKQKATAEVNKVAAAVAALQDAEVIKARELAEAETAAAARAAGEVQNKAEKGRKQSRKVKAAAAKLQAEAEAKAAILAADLAAASERRQAELERRAAKGSKEVDKVSLATWAMAHETEAKSKRLNEKLERAESYRQATTEENASRLAARREQAIARLEAATTASLEKGAAETQRELAAAEKREMVLERRAAKAHAEAFKVEAAAAKLSAEAAAKRSKLEARLDAAASRKAEVRGRAPRACASAYRCLCAFATHRTHTFACACMQVRYPACARPAKVAAQTTALATRSGPLRKIALAFAGGVVARSLVHLLRQPSAASRMFSTFFKFGARFGK